MVRFEPFVLNWFETVCENSGVEYAISLLKESCQEARAAWIGHRAPTSFLVKRLPKDDLAYTQWSMLGRALPTGSVR